MAVTRSKKPVPLTITPEEFELVKAALKAQKKKPNPLYRAWSSFFNSVLNNPKTTLAALGAAVPVLTQAVERQDYVLAISGLGMLMSGALAGDARKLDSVPPTPTDEPG